MDLLHLTSEELLNNLKALKGTETKATLSILYHLNELDVRGLYREAGYSSLWDYCAPRIIDFVRSRHIRPAISAPGSDAVTRSSVAIRHRLFYRREAGESSRHRDDSRIRRQKKSGRSSGERA